MAIHGMNNSERSSDLLFVAELQTNDYDLEKEIWKLIDEEAFYTFWTVEGLLSFWDGYSGNRNNFFVYLNPETDKFHFLPWGADSMFEKYSPLGVDRRSPRSVRTVGLVAHKLYQIPAVRKKYAASMKQLMATHWDEDKLLAETERVEAMVDPHLSREQRRKGDYEKIRRFIRNRRADVEREISGEDMPLWSAAPEPPPVIGGEWGETGGKMTARIRRKMVNLLPKQPHFGTQPEPVILPCSSNFWTKGWMSMPRMREAVQRLVWRPRRTHRSGGVSYWERCRREPFWQ